MPLSINRVLAPITVLGAGRRVGVWVQGCALACPGCTSVDTWDRARGTQHEPEELAVTIADQVKLENLDGLTITGGEPLDQPDQLATLVMELRAQLATWPKAATFDVLLFSGYSTKAATRRGGSLWSLLDAAVCGPYRYQLPSDVPLVASSNQELIVLTDVGRSKYPLEHAAPRMQLASDGESLTMVGLPRPGELDLFASRLAERGVKLTGVSWQT